MQFLLSENIQDQQVAVATRNNVHLSDYNRIYALSFRDNLLALAPEDVRPAGSEENFDQSERKFPFADLRTSPIFQANVKKEINRINLQTKVTSIQPSVITCRLNTEINKIWI